MFVTVDKHQRFKSLVSQKTSIRLEHSSSNAEKSYGDIRDMLVNSKLFIISSNCRLRCY